MVFQLNSAVGCSAHQDYIDYSDSDFLDDADTVGFFLGGAVSL